MDCSMIRQEMVLFYFGDVSTEQRLKLEEHIASCPECLRSYFALKRSVEVDDKPSAAAKNRLRAAVWEEVELKQRSPKWSWWERPLAVALATVSIFFAVATVETIASIVRVPSQVESFIGINKVTPKKN